MSNYIKKEQLSGQKIVVGDKHTDLVLRTLGRVYVQTGSKLTLLSEMLEAVSSASDKKDNLKIVNTQADLTSMPYPGDSVFVFVNETQNLYIGTNGILLPIIAKNEAAINWESIKKRFVSKDGDIMSGDLAAPNLIASNKVIINGSIQPPLEVESRAMVENLNVEFLGGYKEDSFARKPVDEEISGNWDFKGTTSYTGNSEYIGDLVSKGGFVPGFNGYGWKLDSSTNTLTIDNLVVRKIMHVYELVVNKISATNGSLWVSDSAKIESVKMVQYIAQKSEEQDQNPTISDDGDIIVDIDELDTKTTFIKANLETEENAIYPIYDYYFNGSFYEIELDDDNAKYCPFKVNDILRVQRFTGTSIKFYNCIVTLVDYRLDDSGDVQKSNYMIIRMEGIEYSDLDDILYMPEKGDGLVRVGNISNKDRQGAIYLTSNDKNAPFMDITTGMYRPDYSVPLPYYDEFKRLKYEKTTTCRLGKLDGITDPAFGVDQPKGMGLLAENVYLKGKFVQVENGIDFPMPLYKGDYDPQTTYYYYNYVSYEYKSWLCINPDTVGIKGITPSEDGVNWKLYKEGEVGPQGEDGPSLVYNGEYNKDIQYYNRPDVRTVVGVPNSRSTTYTYYQTKTVKEVDPRISPPIDSDGNIPIPKNELPWAENSNYWKSFGAQFSSVATDTLFAENANVAGFVFQKNNDGDSLLRSEKEVAGSYGLKINATTGMLECENAKIRGEIAATSGRIGYFVIEGGDLVGYDSDGVETTRIGVGMTPEIDTSTELVAQDFDFIHDVGPVSQLEKYTIDGLVYGRSWSVLYWDTDDDSERPQPHGDTRVSIGLEFDITELPQSIGIRNVKIDADGLSAGKFEAEIHLQRLVNDKWETIEHHDLGIGLYNVTTYAVRETGKYRFLFWRAITPTISQGIHFWRTSIELGPLEFRLYSGANSKTYIYQDGIQCIQGVKRYMKYTNTDGFEVMWDNLGFRVGKYGIQKKYKTGNWVDI